MPHVKEIARSDLEETDRAIYKKLSGDYGYFENQAKILAHRPPAFRHLFSMLFELAEEEVLPKRYLEIALVTVSRLNACEYCVVHHTPRLSSYGVDPISAEKILESEIPGFDAIDILVRDFSVQVTRQPQRIKDSTFAKLRKHFDDSQIVELTLRISLCGFFNRFNDALQINIEQEAAAEYANI